VNMVNSTNILVNLVNSEPQAVCGCFLPPPQPCWRTHSRATCSRQILTLPRR